MANMLPSDLGYLVNGAISAGLDPRTISLELQHVGALDSLPAKETAVMEAMRQKGVRIALDRFGCVASIAHLRKLVCDEIKVDPSFLKDLEQDGTAQAMLLGIADVARRLRLSCVACSVDTPAQLAFLRRNAWDLGQGAVFGEPLAGLAFAAKWLTRSGKPQRLPFPDVVR
jgi:diguanylate cyclase